MVRIHCMQQWFDLSDQGMEEAFFDTPIYREFAGLDAHGRVPDESTILRFRHRLEKHNLAEQILATVNELLAAQGLLLKAGTAVCAVQPVNGAPPIAGGAGMSAPENRQGASKTVQMARRGVKSGANTRTTRLRLRDLKIRALYHSQIRVVQDIPSPYSVSASSYDF